MGWDEHVMLIAHTVNQFGREIKVIGNTGSNSTGEAVHATEQGFAVGMHAALHINPYYGKTSVRAWVVGWCSWRPFWVDASGFGRCARARSTILVCARSGPQNLPLQLAF